LISSTVILDGCLSYISQKIARLLLLLSLGLDCLGSDRFIRDRVEDVSDALARQVASQFVDGGNWHCFLRHFSSSITPISRVNDCFCFEVRFFVFTAVAAVDTANNYHDQKQESPASDSYQLPEQ